MCPYCSNKFSKQGLKSHIWYSHTEDGKKNKKQKSEKRTGNPSWNKGLTKETDERVAKLGKTISDKHSKGEIKKPWLGKKLPAEHIEKIKKNGGGYRKGSGRGKSGWYKGFWCDSSYELAFVIYNLEHSIKFERNFDSFEYEFNGKKLNYTPDFKINEQYIEIKGYETAKDKEKHKQFPHLLIVLKKGDMQHIFKYVTNKYGEEYIQLYNDYSESKHHCNNCGVEISKYGKTGLCIRCWGKTQQKVNRPPRNTLLESLLTKGFKETGKTYGVSDNTIRKWCISNNLPHLMKTLEKERTKLEKELEKIRTL
ncbi:hypothetical protein QTG56_25320 (plasmid) [Rossellomorea sp. AcN35-11]|nr:hypothetical protein QTG56_25320 [Rossellomorea sp. AcN35-11]